MAEVEIPGGKIVYAEKGAGTPVILLHGIGGDHREWTSQLEAYSSHFRVLAPDLRGHGDTPAPSAEVYTPFDHAKDVVAWMDQLGLDRAFVVGLSFGGFVALALAIRHAPRLRGLVLVSTTPFMDKYTQGIGQSWAEAFQKGGFDGYMDREIQDIFDPDWLMEHLDDADKFKESRRGRDLSGVVPSSRGNLTWDVRPEIGKIKMPALVVHSLGDRVVDATWARILRQSILGSEMKLYANAGHALLWERPDEFNGVVLDFLRRHDVRATT